MLACAPSGQSQGPLCNEFFTEQVHLQQNQEKSHLQSAHWTKHPFVHGHPE